jgi:hypothetical protein
MLQLMIGVVMDQVFFFVLVKRVNCEEETVVQKYTYSRTSIEVQILTLLIVEQLTSAEEETNTDFTGTKVRILTPVIVEQLTSAEEETSGHNLVPGCEGAPYADSFTGTKVQIRTQQRPRQVGTISVLDAKVRSNAATELHCNRAATELLQY